LSNSQGSRYRSILVVAIFSTCYTGFILIKAIFIIVIACLIITGIATLIASVFEVGDTVANSLQTLRETVNTIGLMTIAIILIGSFIGGRGFS